MAPPAARWPDALRLSNRKAASSRLFSQDFLLHSPFFFFLCGAGALAREEHAEPYSARTAEGGCPHMVYLCSFPKALISTSTPAGRSSFISASTVCGVGSRMSSKRL